MQVICFFLILTIFPKNLGIASPPTLWSLANEESCTHYGIFECGGGARRLNLSELTPKPVKN